MRLLNKSLNLSSLQLRCIFMVTLLTMLIFGLYGYYAIKKQRHVAQSDLQSTANVIGDLYAKTLAVGVWRLDKVAVSNELKALENHPSYCGATVKTSNGQIFSQHTVSDRKGEFIQIARDIIYNTGKKFEHIGTFEICFSTIVADIALGKEKIRLIITSLILLIATLLAVKISLTFIFSPLRKLQEALPGISKNLDLVSNPSLTKRDEIGAVTKTLNDLIGVVKKNQSEILQTRDEAILLKEEAEESSYAKSRFLATMSHELRTPLNGVIGMTELMMNTNMNDKQKKYAVTINNSAEVLLMIISDILDFSKIESGDLTIEPVPICLYQHVKEVMGFMIPQAEENNIKLLLDFPRDIRGGFELDPIRIKQVILNVVGNAIKFSANSNVAVSVSERKTKDDESILRFEVKDNGIGIRKDKQDKIFEHFTQADVSTTRQYGGVGLGLAICKKLIELMEGDIGVNSRIDEGSTFWFEFPTRSCTIEQPEPAHSASEQITMTSKKQDNAPELEKEKEKEPADVLKKTKGNTMGSIILLAEDSLINRVFAEEVLLSIGYQVDVAENGQIAVNMTENKAYDLIIMDCMMPEMDGYEATRSIREKEKENGNHIPIIALTANAMEGDKQKCLDAGMDGYLSKPARQKEIKSMLEKHLGSNAAKS